MLLADYSIYSWTGMTERSFSKKCRQNIGILYTSLLADWSLFYMSPGASMRCLPILGIHFKQYQRTENIKHPLQKWPIILAQYTWLQTVFLNKIPMKPIIVKYALIAPECTKEIVGEESSHLCLTPHTKSLIRSQHIRSMHRFTLSQMNRYKTEPVHAMK